ncbi:hypothetical protein VaNZ11_007396 [Volvox africanus]|uniref:ubiquitinyl hydrolase 1 n=1 Tax=Volvox africanus TaxID=51714 RepID=A0ABQ5S444_9CHLO|nr:hypothetical protein VaNZ11_007396 [Volvox africanus]
MSGGEGDLSPAHWRQASRGGRQASGRSGSSNANYYRSQQHYRDHQYDDLRQQSNYQGERGFSHRGQQHGRSYGSFAQQQDGISVQHEDQRHHAYSRHNPIDHPHAGFRGQPMGPRFNPAEGRQPGYMHYPPESMLAVPPRAPEHWQSGPVPSSYQHPSVSSEGIHAQYGRPTAFVDQPQYPLPQPFPQHQVAGGHLGAGIGMCAGGPVGGSVAMPGPVYHPSGLRLPHHGGAWTSGAPAPEHRTSEAFRGGGSVPGRGAGGRGSSGQSRGGIRDGGVANSGGVGSISARRTSRAPPVPQPLVQNASPQGEPVNSGILSLGRPRQQPLNTVNNVQSVRGATSDAAQTLSSTNNSKSERVPADAANKGPAESGGEPAPAAETAALAAGVEVELGIQDKVDEVPPMPLAADEEVHMSFPTGPLGPASSEAVPPAGLDTMIESASGCTESGIYLSNPSTTAGSPPACAAVNNIGTLRATGSIHPQEQERQALVEGPNVAQALQNSNPLPQASSPLEAMPGSVQAAGEKPVVPGSAWRQRPATALFASPAAGGHAAIRKANAPAAHSATAPQGGAGPGATTAMTGMQPTAIASTVSRNSTGPHQNNAPAGRAIAAMGPEQSCVPPPRVQNRPSPIQTGPPQHPRCPPPGFGAAPLASVSPVGAATVPGDQRPVVQQPENAHLSQSPQQQLSPRVSAGSEALGAAVSPARTAQVAQHSSAAEASELSEGMASRKWASVAAKAASSGGAHSKAPIRRPISEGGTSDASTAVAAATLVGLRHAAHQPPGTASGVSPGSTIVPAVAAAASPPFSMGVVDSIQASNATAEVASSISHPVACADGTAIKEPVAPMALGGGTAPQQGHAALSSKAVLQPGPSNVASISTPLQSKPPSGLPSGGPVASAAVKGAAASTTSTPGHRSWVDAAIASPANIKRAPMGPGAGPKQAPTVLGNDTSCSQSAMVSSPVADAATSAAANEPAADANVVEALPGAAAVASGQGVEDTNADILEAETRIRTWEWVATNGGGNSTPAEIPALLLEQESVKPVAVTVDSTTELPEADPRAVEPAAPAEVPAAQAKQSWAAMAAARPPQLTGHAAAQAAAPKRSAAFQGRGLTARERHVQNPNRGLSAQPPEGMFYPPAAAPVPPTAGALTPKKASEDGHGASRPSPTPSHMPSGAVSVKLTVDADTASTAAAVTPTTHTVGTADLSTASAVAASASDFEASATAGAQPASSVDVAQQGVKSGVSGSHGGPAASSASAKGNVTAAAVPGMPRQTDALHERRSSITGSEPGAVKTESAGHQADGDDTGFQLVVPRHKAGKFSRGTDAGHSHPGPSTGTAGASAGRGRGRYGDVTAAAAAPQQRGAGAHGHLALQGGRGKGAAGHPLQQSPQQFAAGGKHGATAPADMSMGPVATIPGASSSPIVQPASTTNSTGSAVLGVLADAQANANGASVPLAVLEPLAVPAVSEADLAARKEAAAVVPTVRQDDTAIPTVVVTLPVAIAASAASFESLAAQENVAAQGITAIVVSPNEAMTPVPEDMLTVGKAEASVAALPPPDDAAKKTPVQRTQSQARGPNTKKKDKKDSTEAVPRAAEREQEAKPLEEGEEDDDDDDGSAAIPTGSNPWDLLGAAGEEDGAATAAAEVPAVAGAAAGNGVASLAISVASSSEASLVEALRQLLTPATAEQLLAASQIQHQAGGFRLQPRGLTNTGNTCFINATMQALLACAPFAFVLSRLPTIAPLLEPSKSPALHGLALFLGELVSPQSGAAGFASAGSMPGGREDAQQAAEDEGWAEVLSHRGKKGQRKGTSTNAPQQPASPMVPAPATSSSTVTKGEAPGSVAVVLGGQPLVPSMLNGIVAAFNPRISIAERQTMTKVLSKGVIEQEQQDAQEFFLFLVNQVHEEVVALRKAHGLATEQAATAGTGADIAGADGEEWAQVGRKNKATVTRQVGAPPDDAASRSPVTAIFSGLVKSTVRFQQPNYKPSATIEAFNMLHLDIAAEGVNTLEDALRQHSVPESIEYKPDGATEILLAKKDAKLYRLPEVLVLHLKRFTYTAAGGGRYTKVQKPVTFNCTLRLEGKILAEDCPDRANSEYRLFATINHHGRTIAGGHYMTDVLQPDNRWLRFNDAEVYVVTESAVLGERPYLLFYQRVPQRGA